MRKNFIERLAQELAEEQQKLFMQQTIVDGIKDAIQKKKMEVIRQKLENRYVNLNGKRGIVLLIEDYPNGDYFNVHITFGMDPEIAIQKGTKLTPKQKRLLKTYTDRYGQCKKDLNSWDGSEAAFAASELQCSKKSISLTFEGDWNIFYDDAVNPDFFERSGLGVGTIEGPGNKMKMVEDCTERIIK